MPGAPRTCAPRMAVLRKKRCSEPEPFLLNVANSKNDMNEALLTDLYQFTMLQGYFERGLQEKAVFEFFIRKLPRERNFLVAAGLQQALEYLENFHFAPEDLQWLSQNGQFRPDFVKHL